MKKKIRRILMCFILAACAAMAMFLLVDFGENTARPFFALIATIAGTLLGFAMTSLAILVSVSNSKLLNNAKKIGLYDKLVHGIYAAAGALFLTMAAPVVLFFYVNNFSMALIVFLFAVAIVLLFSVGRIFFLILGVLGEPEGDKYNID